MSKIGLIQKNDYFDLTIDGVSVGGAWVGQTEIVPNKDFMGPNSRVIMNFNVLSEHRGKGLGKVLMSRILENEKQSGTKYLRLGVEIANEVAIKVYEGAGFTRDGLLYNTMHYMWKKL